MVRRRSRTDGRRALARALCVLAVAVACALPSGASADEIGAALEASRAALKAARESQERIGRLDDETRELQEQLRAAQWKAQQLSAYAVQLEKEAQAEEEKRAGLQAQLERIAATGRDLQPLLERMLAELEAWVAGDLPFLAHTRSERIAALRALLADPGRGVAEKYRRVLDAYRTEVDYGYSVGAEQAEMDCGGVSGAAGVVRIGRVGLYCLAADGQSAGYWDSASRRWRSLDEDAIEDVQRALAIARGEAPPGLLVLPVRVPGDPS